MQGSFGAETAVLVIVAFCGAPQDDKGMGSRYGSTLVHVNPGLEDSPDERWGEACSILSAYANDRR